MPYGTTPTYNGTTPTKAATAQYTYTFSGWSPAVAGITGNTTYTAQFSSTVNNYTVSIASSNSGYGTVDKASVTSVPYGTKITVNSNKITVNGTTITASEKADTAQYTYTFTGWSIANNYEVVGATSITANFTRTLNNYTVTIKSNNDAYGSV